MPIPLADGDPDVLIDFQAIFASTYQRGHYHPTLDYDAPPPPPALSAADSLWAHRLLESAGLRSKREA